MSTTSLNTIKSSRNRDRIEFLNNAIKFAEKKYKVKSNLTKWHYLDVGCNTAEMTLAISKFYKFAVTCCTDVMTPAEFKKNAAPGVIKSNIVYRKVQFDYKIPFPAESMDLLTCFQAIHHFTKPVEMLESIYKVLKPNGLLYIRDHNADPKNKKLVKYLDGIHEYYGDDPSTITYRSAVQLTKVLKTAGFELIKYFYYRPINPNPQATYHAIYRKV